MHQPCQLLRLGLSDNDLGEEGGALLAELLEGCAAGGGAPAPARTVQVDVRRNGFTVATKLRLLAAVAQQEGGGGGGEDGELVGSARRAGWELTLDDEPKRIDKWPMNPGGPLVPPRTYK